MIAEIIEKAMQHNSSITIKEVTQITLNFYKMLQATTITHELMNPHTQEEFYVDFFTDYNGQPERIKSAFNDRWCDSLALGIDVDWDRSLHTEMENKLIAFHYFDNALKISEELVKVAQQDYSQEVNY